MVYNYSILVKRCKMKVKGKSRKYQYLVNYAISILEKEKIKHDNLYFVLGKEDPDKNRALASFVRNTHPETIDENPTIVIYTSEMDDQGKTEADAKYCTAHEIGHYKDWLEGKLGISGYSSGRCKDEQRVNEFARKITKYKPTWLPAKNV